MMATEAAGGGWCKSRPDATMRSDAPARERRPPVGTARRRRADGKDPEFGGGAPLGRNPGLQHHPNGGPVHAFRCASRSAADRRSGVPVPARRDADRRSAQFFWWAFPDRRRHPDRWRTRGTCIFTATAGRSAFPCLRAAFWRRRLAARAKNNGSEPLVRCLRDWGESVKGGLAPLSQKETRNRNLP